MAPSFEEKLVDEGITVGKPIYLKGTGKWWAGQYFGATIVDVRADDKSVKVRYVDGGYRRFKYEEFKSLVSNYQVPAESFEEWNPTAHRRVTTKASDMQQLHDKIMTAVKKGEFLEAHKLQEEFTKRAAEADILHDLQNQLIDKVAKGDYKGAHEVQEKINATVGAEAGKTAAPPASRPGVSDKPTMGETLQKAAYRALGGGLSGAAAMIIQVSSLMWLRTTMNYQYRYGTSTLEALKALYAQGGVLRFYQGYVPALIQGPASRFGDTAANAGVLALFESNDAVKNWPTPVKTVFGSLCASSMRCFLVPVDTVKTIMQVEGKEGLPKLKAKFQAGGVPVFFHGAGATLAATFVGHYPWFTVFNTLNANVPNFDERSKKLLRNAGIGFCASVTSDTVSNSLRVVKTIRQTDATTSYQDIVKGVIEKDGVMGLMGRGLKTRIIANGAQGIMFSVLYKMFEEQFMKKK